MNPLAKSIADRLSLRAPQRESLALLDRLCEAVPLVKGQDLDRALAAARRICPTLESFDRDFPSYAFALATGVGKTRLMGAFIAYLARVHGLRHRLPLRRAGLVESKRGAQGGYTLSRPPEAMRVGEIYRVMEGPVAPMDCVSEDESQQNCPLIDNCETRPVWLKV